MILNKHKLKFGIIGCSGVAERRFLPALMKSTLAKLEHIGSRTREKAEKYANNFLCPKIGFYENVIEDPEVDAVYISIPVTLRDPWIKKAIKNKKHILCEKPAFDNLQSAIETIRLCKDFGVRIMECYMFQYHPQHLLVSDLIKENRIGTPKIFTGEYMVPKPNIDSIKSKQNLGGGVFLDSVGYLPIAAELHLKSTPLTVLCKRNIDPITGIDDVVIMMVEYSCGTFGYFSSAYGLQHRSCYSLHGTSGRIEVKRAFAVNSDIETIVELETDNGIQKLSVAPANQFLLMIDDFATQVTKQTDTFRDFEGSLLRQQVFMEAAKKSFIEGNQTKLKHL